AGTRLRRSDLPRRRVWRDPLEAGTAVRAHGGRRLRQPGLRRARPRVRLRGRAGQRGQGARARSRGRAPGDGARADRLSGRLPRERPPRRILDRRGPRGDDPGAQRDLNRYLTGLGAASPVKSLRDLIRFNEARPRETLRFGQSEPSLIRLAYAFERVTRHRRPPASVSEPTAGDGALPI